MPAEFKKSDDELQIVFSEVYAPGIPDSQGDYMVASQIAAMAHDFMRSGKLNNIDREHDNRTFGACVVESFIARDNDDTFIPGSWVIGVHIPDPVQWALVKNGTFNGFSLDGEGERQQQDLDVSMPDVITGETSETNGHTHKFVVAYDKDGKFLGGKTSEDDGHFHEIIKGTATEEANGHSHRFSHVEQINGQSDS